MGRIEEKRKKRRDTKNPLSEIGNRNEKNKEFDLEKDTIKDKKDKE